MASCAPEPLIFKEVFPDTDKGIERVSEGVTFRQYYFYFIVSNYQNSKQNNAAKDSFANAIIANTVFFENTSSIWINFLKETRQTNLDEIQKWPRGFFLNSIYEDILFKYRYELDGLKEKTRYKNGNEVESWPAKEKSKVKFTIIPVPDSTYN